MPVLVQVLMGKVGEGGSCNSRSLGPMEKDGGVRRGEKFRGKTTTPPAVAVPAGSPAQGEKHSADGVAPYRMPARYCIQ